MDDTIARALFSFSAHLQQRVMATDFPAGWEWRMHPGTWNRVRADVKAAQYITPNVTEPFAKADDLLGCPVIIDGDLPVGAVELRFADQMMLPLGERA